MELKTLIIIILIMWLLIVQHTIRYSKAMFPIVCLISILWNSYTVSLKLMSLKLLNHLSELLAQPCDSWDDFSYLWYDYLYVMLIVFVILCIIYRVVFIFICDCFRILYYLFPNSEQIVKNQIGFTTIEEFLDLYPLIRLNLYLCTFFSALVIYWLIMDFSPLYLQFIYIIWFESYLILIFTYNVKEYFLTK